MKLNLIPNFIKIEIDKIIIVRKINIYFLKINIKSLRFISLIGFYLI